MGKIIFGVLTGFIVWTILWLGSNGLLAAISPDLAFADAGNISTNTLIIGLIRSIISSIIAGFIAVLVSGEFSKTTLYLGILLLLVGIFFQVSAWNIMPVWYHLIFLLLLIPMTIFGGKFRRA